MARALIDPAFAAEPLSLDWIDGVNWRVTREYLYHTAAGLVVIPVGSVTDFASIPRPLWSVGLSPTGPYGPAAVLHDGMFKTGRWSPNGPACTFDDANTVLNLAMGDLPAVSGLQRWLVYHGVLVGGRHIWDTYRAMETAQLPLTHADTLTAMVRMQSFGTA